MERKNEEVHWSIKTRHSSVCLWIFIRIPNFKILFPLPGQKPFNWWPRCSPHTMNFTGFASYSDLINSGLRFETCQSEWLEVWFNLEVHFQRVHKSYRTLSNLLVARPKQLMTGHCWRAEVAPSSSRRTYSAKADDSVRGNGWSKADRNLSIISHWISIEYPSGLCGMVRSWPYWIQTLNSKSKIQTLNAVEHQQLLPVEQFKHWILNSSFLLG